MDKQGKVNYVDLIKPSPAIQQVDRDVAKGVSIKQPTFINGIPRVTWTKEEVTKMNVMENLQYAIIGKFSYRWPDLDDLGIQIPKKCNIKGECKIGLLRNRHMLLRLRQIEDFATVMPNNIYYVIAKDGLAYQMRPLIYNAKFKPEEETAQAMAWISFPDLLPTFCLEGINFLNSLCYWETIALGHGYYQQNEA